jgi:AcrR family transcriptional regulator
MAEREEQKRRTRAELLNGARNLMLQGKTVTVTAAAKESGISKATAYRYYSDPALLAAEAGLAFRMQPYEVITQDCRTLRERLVALSLYYFDLSMENEAAFRTYLGLFLQASASGPEDGPERGARRVEAYRRALEAADPTVEPACAEKVTAALSVCTGSEAMIALIDIAKCTPEQAREMVRELTEAVVDRFLPEH